MDAATPLHYAIRTGAAGASRVLIQNDADLLARDKHGMLPLHLATLQADLDFFKLMLNETDK